MTTILGKSVATAEQMAAYLLSKNPSPSINMEPVAFCRLFLYMGALEGVRGDGLFAQSCKETGNFKYGGTVTADQNNYGGLGTTDATTKGAYFPDEATGILAQAQHAKGYDGTPLNFDCVDPRYELLVKYGKTGTAKHWEELGGSWAVPGYNTKKYNSLKEANDAKDSYGYQIINILNDILAMPTGESENNKTVVVPEKEPVKEPDKEEIAKPLAGRKMCLDAGHFRPDYNKCPAIPEYAESNMAWILHLLLKKYLEEMGATVIITRADQNKDLALYSRGAAAKGCDLFLSLHSNAVGSGMNETVDYAAVYHLTEDVYATCDDVSKEIARVLAPVIAQTMGTTQGYKVLTRLASSDKNKDGILNDNYYGVLNGARQVDVPGLILEHSFHTNTKAVRWLLQDSNLDTLARAEAKAIASYFSGKEVTVVPTGGVPYTIRVSGVPAGDVLNIRKEPNHKADITGSLAYNDPYKYTIVAEQNGWGKLKSDKGWINLKYTVRA